MMLCGELELILDGGETVNLSSGDIMVQRGTSHAWPNPGAECKFILCMIEA
jgi:quercetin dioxygenase-like cupin family protein